MRTCYGSYDKCAPRKPSHRISRDHPERGFYRFSSSNDFACGLTVLLQSRRASNRGQLVGIEHCATGQKFKVCKDFVCCLQRICISSEVICVLSADSRSIHQLRGRLAWLEEGCSMGLSMHQMLMWALEHPASEPHGSQRMI
ncbi:TPA: hypothetical protein ACH3X3_001077 [Trebouxia sp. C0006]